MCVLRRSICGCRTQRPFSFSTTTVYLIDLVSIKGAAFAVKFTIDSLCELEETECRTCQRRAQSSSAKTLLQKFLFNVMAAL
mmetsp:Transcript_38947/g.94294  ORF Transcript_38947/g.94294 Transcript_38947/m.94294 type:complete len:82 (-) Transcript_38947:63-308(-)